MADEEAPILEEQLIEETEEEAEPPEETDFEQELERLRKENRRLTEDAMTARKQIELYRSNMPGPQQVPQGIQDPLAELDPNDVLTAAQLQQIMRDRDFKIGQAFQILQRGMRQEQIKSSYPDFFPVMQDLILELQQNDPQSAQRLMNADDETLRWAYEAHKAKKAQGAQPQPKKSDAQRRAENLKKPQITGQTQSGGGGINNVEAIKRASPEEFRKMWENHRQRLREGKK